MNQLPASAGNQWLQEHRLQELEALARAVIAAGRPHPTQPYTMLGEPPHVCQCPQCAAWDALAELLKTP